MEEKQEVKELIAAIGMILIGCFVVFDLIWFHLIDEMILIKVIATVISVFVVLYITGAVLSFFDETKPPTK